MRNREIEKETKNPRIDIWKKRNMEGRKIKNSRNEKIVKSKGCRTKSENLENKKNRKLEQLEIQKTKYPTVEISRI